MQRHCYYYMDGIRSRITCSVQSDSQQQITSVKQLSHIYYNESLENKPPKNCFSFLFIFCSLFCCLVQREKQFCFFFTCTLVVTTHKNRHTWIEILMWIKCDSTESLWYVNQFFCRRQIAGVLLITRSTHLNSYALRKIIRSESRRERRNIYSVFNIQHESVMFCAWFTNGEYTNEKFGVENVMRLFELFVFIHSFNDLFRLLSIELT